MIFDHGPECSVCASKRDADGGNRTNLPDDVVIENLHKIIRNLEREKSELMETLGVKLEERFRAWVLGEFGKGRTR